MSKKIVYKRASDGGISVVSPSETFLAKFSTEAEGIAAAQAKSVPGDAVDVAVVESTEIPTNREFRNAWTRAPGGGPVSIDMPAAREIHADRMARSQVVEIVRLNKEERLATLAGRTADAAKHASDRSAIENEDQTALANQISNAPNTTVLSNIWPQKVPR